MTTDDLFEYNPDGRPTFRGLAVEERRLCVAGRWFTLHALRDAADLLDEPDFAQRFIEQDMAPYGMELWPAASMLAETILLGEEGQGRSAIELGCGLGLVSMAAALKGWQVIATDHEPTSLRFARHNASLNGIELAGFELLDWHHPPVDRRYDRVFGADLLYQLVDHEPLLSCVEALLANSGLALLSDPNRSIAEGFEGTAQKRGFSIGMAPGQSNNIQGETIGGRVWTLAKPGER